MQEPYLHLNRATAAFISSLVHELMMQQQTAGEETTEWPNAQLVLVMKTGSDVYAPAKG